MVLSLKRWKSRSSPGIVAGAARKRTFPIQEPIHMSFPRTLAGRHAGAGWSSPVARQAHNLKVTGSNPVPATNATNDNAALRGGVVVCSDRHQIRHLRHHLRFAAVIEGR